jgi:hypothetical protein
VGVAPASWWAQSLIMASVAIRSPRGGRVTDTVQLQVWLKVKG